MNYRKSWPINSHMPCSSLMFKSTPSQTIRQTTVCHARVVIFIILISVTIYLIHLGISFGKLQWVYRDLPPTIVTLQIKVMCKLENRQITLSVFTFVCLSGNFMHKLKNILCSFSKDWSKQWKSHLTDNAFLITTLIFDCIGTNANL